MRFTRRVVLETTGLLAAQPYLGCQVDLLVKGRNTILIEQIDKLPAGSAKNLGSPTRSDLAKVNRLSSNASRASDRIPVSGIKVRSSSGRSISTVLIIIAPRR